LAPNENLATAITAAEPAHLGLFGGQADNSQHADLLASSVNEVGRCATDCTRMGNAGFQSLSGGATAGLFGGQADNSQHADLLASSVNEVGRCATDCTRMGNAGFQSLSGGATA
jgi:hypothetical protein